MRGRRAGVTKRKCMDGAMLCACAVLSQFMPFGLAVARPSMLQPKACADTNGGTSYCESGHLRGKRNGTGLSFAQHGTGRFPPRFRDLA